MAKTNKIIYSIFDQCTGKVPSDDSRLEESLILHVMNDVRALLIRQEIVSGRRLDESYYQLKCCIEVVCDDIVCSGIDSGKNVYYARIPKLIEGIGFKNISFLGTVEFPERFKGLKSNFDRYTMNGWLAMDHLEWANLRPSYSVVGGYMDGDTIEDGTIALLKNLPKTGIKRLCIMGIFANPEELPCDEEEFMEMEYPIPTHMIHRLEMITIQQLLSTESVPGDPTQDSRDNTGGQLNPNVAKNLPNQEDYKSE